MQVFRPGKSVALPFGPHPKRETEPLAGGVVRLAADQLCVVEILSPDTSGPIQFTPNHPELWEIPTGARITVAWCGLNGNLSVTESELEPVAE